MPQTRDCDFCGDEIPPGTGTMFVHVDGTAIHYCSSKCEKNANLGREPRDLEWVQDEEADRLARAEAGEDVSDDEEESADAEDDAEAEDAAADADADEEAADADESAAADESDAADESESTGDEDASEESDAADADDAPEDEEREAEAVTTGEGDQA